MSEYNYEELKLENQICFPLYVCSKEIIRRYKPFLDEIDLTYTQYIAMLVLWEDKEVNVKELGNRLFLDSGTLTPMLKKLESKGFVTRNRSRRDERNLIISITPEGEKLKEKAVSIPGQVSRCIKIPEEKASELYDILFRILGCMD